jgi:hypothetical protein
MRFAYMSLKNKGVLGFCGGNWHRAEILASAEITAEKACYI